MGPKTRDSEEAIALKRAERARKRAEQETQNPDDVLDAASHSLVYNFIDHEVIIEEDWSGDGSALAGLQWLGGVLLARYFDNKDIFPPHFFKQKRVLELGAGCGLTSILLALLGAEVTITDLDVEKAIPNVEANLSAEERSRVTLVNVDWTNPNLEDLGAPFDIIVAGDCCYDTECIAPLFNTMVAASSPSTEIYLCGIVGQIVLEKFNEIVDDFFDVERLDAPQTEGSDTSTLDGRLRALMRMKLKPEASVS